MAVLGLFLAFLLGSSSSSAQSVVVIHENLCERAVQEDPVAMPNLEHCLEQTQLWQVENKFFIGFVGCATREWINVSYVTGSNQINVERSPLGMPAVCDVN